MTNKQEIAWITAIIVVVGFSLALLFWTKTESVTLVTRQWHTELDIEDFQPRKRGDWTRYVPSDAYDLNTYQKQSGTSCTTIGKVKSCVPTYSSWTDYTVNRWGYLETLANDGNLDQHITIPEPSIECPNVEEIGCQRYGASRIDRKAEFQRTAGDLFWCSYDKEFWESLADGTQYSMVFGVIRNEPRCAIGNH